MVKPSEAGAKPGDDWGDFEKSAEKGAPSKGAAVDFTRPPFLVAYAVVGLVITVLVFRAIFGSSSGPALTRVTGMVMMGGKPLGGAVVTFHPSSKNGRVGEGRTNAQGHFVISTVGVGPGVAVDEYRVTVSKFASEEKIMSPDEAKKYTSKEGKAPPMPKVNNLVSATYASVQSTPLTASVKTRRAVTCRFDLK